MYVAIAMIMNKPFHAGRQMVRQTRTINTQTHTDTHRHTHMYIHTHAHTHTHVIANTCTLHTSTINDFCMIHGQFILANVFLCNINIVTVSM